MLYSFHTVELKDIDGNVLPDSKAHKTLAGVLYRFATELDLVDKALEMNRGKPVELSSKEVEEVKKVIDRPDVALSAFVRKALLDHIKKVESEKKEPSKEA